MRRQIFAPFFYYFFFFRENVCLSTCTILIFYFFLPQHSHFLSVYCRRFMYFSPFYLSLTLFLCVSTLFWFAFLPHQLSRSVCVLATTTLQTVANIVYFVALCQRWMLQAIVVIHCFPSPFFFCVASRCFYFCVYVASSYMCENFPHKLFKSLFMFGLITIFYIRNRFSHSLATASAIAAGIIKRPGKASEHRKMRHLREENGRK